MLQEIVEFENVLHVDKTKSTFQHIFHICVLSFSPCVWLVCVRARMRARLFSFTETPSRYSVDETLFYNL